MLTDNAGLYETAMDIEYLHAMAPAARLDVVETSNDVDSITEAVRTARTLPGVSVVSMSIGQYDSRATTRNDSLFTTPPHHRGVTFVGAVSDDPHDVPSYPAGVPTVLAAGETNYSLFQGESATPTAGGPDKFQSQPVWQSGVVQQQSTYRALPDVAFPGAYATELVGGLAELQYYEPSLPEHGWYPCLGSSYSTLGWAALITLIDQVRASRGLNTLDGAKQTLPAIYSLPSSDFNDITSVYNTGGPYPVEPGYDYLTGRGSPVVPLVARDLIAFDAKKHLRT